MQIVIEISDTLKKILDSHDIITASHPMWVAIMMDAIANGTPLPKGHGRLIDVDKLELDDGYSNYDGYYHRYSQSQICNAPTIIEADAESEG